MTRSTLTALLASVLVLLSCMNEGGNQGTSSASYNEDPEVEALVARAKSFELPTEWVRPPGDPLHHHTGGFAKILCSAVFITGLDADFAAENIGYFTSDYDQRSKVTNREIDMENKLVRLTLPDALRARALHRVGGRYRATHLTITS